MTSWNSKPAVKIGDDLVVWDQDSTIVTIVWTV